MFLVVLPPAPTQVGSPATKRVMNKPQLFSIQQKELRFRGCTDSSRAQDLGFCA